MTTTSSASIIGRPRSRRGATSWNALGEALWSLANSLLAMAALIFLLPLLLTIAGAVVIQDGGPILFSQRRIGQGGRRFSCYKFRTMATDAEARLADVLASDPAAAQEWANDYKLRVDPRVTRTGLFLRRSSLDELPQLLNVARGDMNLVGPRPIVDAEIPRYGRAFKHYTAVKPGLTGLWQVSGRNDVSYRRRVAMDGLYARRRSPALDIWILVRTIPAALLCRGSY
jgi:exopolysaccharide production protein ExoY